LIRTWRRSGALASVSRADVDLADTRSHRKSAVAALPSHVGQRRSA
jgi:hypothetical protein